MYGTDDRQVVDLANDDAALATAIILEAATGAKLTKTVVEPITVTRFGFRPTVTFNYDTLTTKGVLTLYKYPAGNSGNKVALATINLEHGDLAGTQYYVNVDNKVVKATSPATGVAPRAGADFQAGDQVVIEVTTQAAGGTEVGDYQPFFCFTPRPEPHTMQDLVVDRTPEKTPVNAPY